MGLALGASRRPNELQRVDVAPLVADDGVRCGDVRMGVYAATVQVSRSEQQAVVGRFLGALRIGLLQGLLEIMAPDMVLADRGGLAAVRTRSAGPTW